MMTTVMPRVSFRCLSSCRIALVVCGSSAEVASSQSSTFGSLASARAIATRCFWPPDSCLGYASALSPIPTSSRSRCTFSAICCLERPLPRSGYATLPATVREGIRLKCWKIMPIFLRACRSCFAESDSHLLTIYDHLARGRPLEQIDAAHQRRFTRTGKADHTENFALVNRQRNILHRMNGSLAGSQTPSRYVTILSRKFLLIPLKCAKKREARSSPLQKMQ